jgi:hypothetical protein
MFRSLLTRRPSAAMVVAVAALFAALGGVGYAASTLPAGSVGRAQIQNNAVNYEKIAPGSVGIVRINPNTVQARVLNNCNVGHSAITAINVHGQPTCKGVLPSEYDTRSGASVAIAAGTTPTPVAAEPLSGATSYLVLADPSIQVTGTAGIDQQVQVQCTLGALPLPGTSLPQSVTLDLTAAHETTSASIPLALTETSNSTTDTVTVACTQTVTGGGTAPTVDVSAQINAIQTNGNTAQANTATTTTTTTTPTTTTTTTTTTPTTTTTTTIPIP